MKRRPRHVLRTGAVILVSLLLTTGPALAQSDSAGTSISVTGDCADPMPSIVRVRGLVDLFLFPDWDAGSESAYTVFANEYEPSTLFVDTNDCVTNWTVVATSTNLVSTFGHVIPVLDHLRINRYAADPCKGPSLWCLGDWWNPVSSAPDTWSDLVPGTPVLFEDVGGVPTRAIGGGSNVDLVSMKLRVRLTDMTPDRAYAAGTYSGTMTFTLTTVEP